MGETGVVRSSVHNHIRRCGAVPCAAVRRAHVPTLLNDDRRGIRTRVAAYLQHHLHVSTGGRGRHSGIDLDQPLHESGGRSRIQNVGWLIVDQDLHWKDWHGVGRTRCYLAVDPGWIHLTHASGVHYDDGTSGSWIAVGILMAVLIDDRADVAASAVPGVKSGGCRSYRDRRVR